MINKPEDPRSAGFPLLARPAHLQGQTESQEGWGLPGGTGSASPLGATAGAANAAQRPDAVDVSWVEQGSGGGTVITDGSREPGAAEVTGVMLRPTPAARRALLGRALGGCCFPCSRTHPTRVLCLLCEVTSRLLVCRVPLVSLPLDIVQTRASLQTQSP